MQLHKVTIPQWRDRWVSRGCDTGCHYEWSAVGEQGKQFISSITATHSSRSGTPLGTPVINDIAGFSVLTEPECQGTRDPSPTKPLSSYSPQWRAMWHSDITGQGEPALLKSH